MIGASNIIDGKLNIVRWIEYPEVVSQKNDILISCKGTIGELIINDFGEIHIARQFMAIRPYSDKFLNIDYLRIVMLALLENIKKQANGIIPGISRPVLLELDIPLPSIRMQRKIVSIVDDLFKEIYLVDKNSESFVAEISHIKSKILELAMQGKLVSQNPADEPAIDMLRRINPKAKIITDNPHYPQLPDNWTLSTIKDVFTINPKNKAEDSTLSGFVPMASIDDGYSNSFTYETIRWGNIKSGLTHFADGDIAVAKISPCLENRKSMVLKNLPNGIGAGTTELLVFRSEIVDSEFALLFFKSDYFIKSCIGTFNGVVGQQRVSKSIVEETTFPLPPYKMQKRIVEIVYKFFDTIDSIQFQLH